MNSNDHISVEAAQIALEIFALSMLITSQGRFTVNCWWCGRVVGLDVWVMEAEAAVIPGKEREPRKIDSSVYLDPGGAPAQLSATRDELRRFLREVSHA